MLAPQCNTLLPADILDMLSAVFGDVDSVSTTYWSDDPELRSDVVTESTQFQSINSCMESVKQDGLLSKDNERSSFLGAQSGRKPVTYRSSVDNQFGKFGVFSSSAPTTLMMKNVPNKLTREELLELIHVVMPRGSFNFLYMPVDFKTRCNFGYAFINLVSEVYIDRFTRSFHKQKVLDDFSSRPVEVVIARVQGFTANINRLISSPVLFQADEGSLPLIFTVAEDAIHSIPFRQLMDLNRASILYHTKPSVEDLIAQIVPYL